MECPKNWAIVHEQYIGDQAVTAVYYQIGYLHYRNGIESYPL
jgi:hypothetical protein